MSGAEAEIARFSRQVLIPGIGPTGQQLIRAARVHVVGAGPTAGPALLFLAQAGVGTLFLDDGDDVAAGDAGAWLYTPEQAGVPRLFAAMGALGAASAFVRVRPHATASDPTATLVCAQREAVARTAAERARLAGLPHVVVLGDDDGGEVVTVPSGAPCLGCASRPGARLPPRPAAASAIGTLGALELLLVVARVLPRGAGRRVDLVEGRVRTEVTTRKPTCDCRNAY